MLALTALYFFWGQAELNIAEATDLPPCLWDWAFRSGLSAWSVCWQTLSEEVTHIFTLVKPLLPDVSFSPWASAVAWAPCAWRTRRIVYTIYSFWPDGLYSKALQMTKHDMTSFNYYNHIQILKLQIINCMARYWRKSRLHVCCPWRSLTIYKSTRK